MFGHFLDKKFSWLFFGNHAKSYLDNSKIWRNDGKTICFTSQRLFVCYTFRLDRNVKKVWKLTKKIFLYSPRYLIVCHPFYTVSHSWSAKRYIIPILIWSLLYNFPKFFELHTTFDQNNYDEYGQGYLVNASEMRLNEYYIKIYCIWMNFVFMGLIPFVALIILNAQTLRSLVLKVIFMKKELKYGT